MNITPETIKSVTILKILRLYRLEIISRLQKAKFQDEIDELIKLGKLVMDRYYFLERMAYDVHLKNG